MPTFLLHPRLKDRRARPEEVAEAVAAMQAEGPATGYALEPWGRLEWL